MELGNDFNKFDGLKSFLMDVFGVDIVNDLKFKVSKPQWVLGQVDQCLLWGNLHDTIVWEEST